MLHFDVLILVTLLAWTSSVTPSLDTCSGGGMQNITVEGWPVMVALRLPIPDHNVALNLSLTHNDDVHTVIMLTHGTLGTRLLETKLRSRMVKETLEMVTRLPGSIIWATLRIVAKDDELELSIQSETRSVSYSTTTLVNTTDHLHVNTVFCSGSKCASYTDLECLYSKGKSSHKEGPKLVSSKSTSDKSPYYWAFYVVVTLLVMSCLLFLIWRNEQKKFMRRRSSRIVTVQASTPYQDTNACQDDGRDQAKEWQVGFHHGHANPAYEE